MRELSRRETSLWTTVCSESAPKAYLKDRLSWCPRRPTWRGVRCRPSIRSIYGTRLSSNLGARRSTTTHRLRRKNNCMQALLGWKRWIVRNLQFRIKNKFHIRMISPAQLFSIKTIISIMRTPHKSQFTTASLFSQHLRTLKQPRHNKACKIPPTSTTNWRNQSWPLNLNSKI